MTIEELYAFPFTTGFETGSGVNFNDHRGAALAQHWLFFGLLSTFLHVQDMEFERTDFVEISPIGNITITLARLPTKLDIWTKKELEKQALEGDAGTVGSRLDKVKDILSYVRTLIDHQIAPNEDQDDLIRVLFSIQALGYTVTCAMKERFPAPFRGFYPSFGTSKILLSRLSLSGWCAHDVAVLKRVFFIDAHYYCTMLPPLRHAFPHQGCSDFSCTAMNINPATYRTLHVSNDCTCDFMAVPLAELHGLVEGFHIPLILYHPPEDIHPNGHLTVVKKTDAPNTVFSHVWADGLGNRGGNSLPICQLSRLQKMSNELFNADTVDPVPFYIDTLCVPRDRDIRKKAIRKMRDVYIEAKRVLVLDQDISSSSMEQGITRISVSLVFSGWMRRLWTYQEGVLNSSLYFQLRDSILPLQTIRDWIHSITQADNLWKGTPGEYSIAKYVLSYLVTTLEVKNTQSMPRSLSLVAICDALNWRSTSRTEDETIVLSIILGHDTAALQDTSNSGSERMKKFLRTIGRIPISLAVYSGDRIEEDGFRWAPKSLLGVRGHTNPEPVRKWYSRMLDVNRGIPDFSNAVDMADVLNTGQLRFRGAGFIFRSEARPGVTHVTSPFWTLLCKGVHPESGYPIVEQPMRSHFVTDADGLPLALPRQTFFIVPVSNPEQQVADRLSQFFAFIAVPTAGQTFNFTEKDFYGGEMQIDTVACKFYCRIVVRLVRDVRDIEKIWPGEAFAEDGSLKFDTIRRLNDVEWLIS
jgi:hypothetical protein